MSLDYNQLDEETISLYEETFKDLIKSIFGSDLDLHYADDGTVDLKVVGGDFNLTGTAIGNTQSDLMKLVKNRLHTRLLTYYSESSLLPNGFGSFLTDVIGVSVSDNDNIESNQSIMNQNDMTGFINGIIRYSLEQEPLVSEVTNIEVDYQDVGTINILITFKSVFLNQMSVNLQLVGE